MRVLVCYEGSTASERALQGLAHAGLPPGTEVLVATVTNPWVDFNPGEGSGSPVADLAARIADQAIEHAGALARKGAARLGKLFPDWRISSESIAGKPAQALLEMSDFLNPGLIVVGSHGRSALGKAVLGSVSLQILHHAKTNVRISRFRPGIRQAGNCRILVGTDGSDAADRILDAVCSRTWSEGAEAYVLAVIDWRVLPTVLINAGNDLLQEHTRNSMETWIESRVDSAARKLELHGLIGSTSSAVAAHAPC